ncbi:hypothetical protein AGDE_17030 [Angomonas deanei]|uniref:Ubiquitin family, putative n=1 Tax=Angomonas deanei TaxID=59799 RepID=A0A7G2CJH3_9TRYP|nr:hypothetical protein AGDE_17030 [Angomonas deanei]CAD2219094.1 Ubiquitin family, putative [Angomonas deanei]|eukprot:EPY15660.1 hypothetical protein AGDE_17030 [Angomonas deanei]
MSRTALSVNVRYGRQKVSVAMEPNETVEDLKRNIEKHLGISPTLQRLLFSAPVLREYRQDPSSSITIEKLVDASDEKSDITELNVLVIPKKEGNPIVNSKVTSEYARLVSTTVEHDGNWYRCNYGDGYLLQRAYVCRTCVEEGRADPNHVLCLACADFCHLEHDVEEWGVRYYTRCDCCTERCWRSDTKGADSPNSPPHVVVSNEDILRRTTKRKRSRSSSPITPKSPFRATPEADQDHTSLPPLPPAAPKHNCAFIVDKDTGKPPVSVVLPANRHNRYPRNPLHWCYCLQDVHKDDPDCEGVTCLLCNSCFWSSHLKRLHTRQFSYVPCYGDVLRGETLAFFCETCDTYVCPPCRFRCHKDHQVKDEPVLGCREDGTDNGAPPEAEFTCGCGPLCQAPERVTGSASENWSDPPPSVAEGLMNLDIFTGFICSFCMQEYPWLYENPPDHCYNGSLPEKKPLTQKVIDCGTSSVEENRDRFPFHGMVVPVTFFKEGSTCACAPCQQAFAQFAPRTDQGS